MQIILISFKLTIHTIGNLAPAVAVYGSVLMSWYYIYVMVAMEIFGDEIKTQDFNNGTWNCYNPDLIGTPFALFVKFKKKKK